MHEVPKGTRELGQATVFHTAIINRCMRPSTGGRQAEGNLLTSLGRKYASSSLLPLGSIGAMCNLVEVGPIKSVNDGLDLLRKWDISHIPLLASLRITELCHSTGPRDFFCASRGGMNNMTP